MLFCRAGLAERRGEHRPAPAPVSGFLGQLAPGCGLDVLALVDNPGRDLVVHVAQARTVLPDQDYLVSRGHRDDVDPGRVLRDPVVGDFTPAGQAEALVAEHQPGRLAEKILGVQRLPGRRIVRKSTGQGPLLLASAIRGGRGDDELMQHGNQYSASCDCRQEVTNRRVYGLWRRGGFQVR